MPRATRERAPQANAEGARAACFDSLTNQRARAAFDSAGAIARIRTRRAATGAVQLVVPHCRCSLAWLAVVCRASCARRPGALNERRFHMRRMDRTPMYLPVWAWRYTFATFPAHRFVCGNHRRVPGKSGVREGGRRSRARCRLHRRKRRIETTQRASKDACDSPRHARSTCMHDSSDNVVRRIARTSGCLSLSCRSGDACARSSCETFRDALFARDGRGTKRAGRRAGWFEYCCSGRT